MTLNDFITLHLDLFNLNINNKKSKICNKRASFNYPNFKEINIRKCIYCKTHKLVLFFILVILSILFLFCIIYSNGINSSSRYIKRYFSDIYIIEKYPS